MINRIKQQISILHRNVMYKSTQETLQRQKTLYAIFIAQNRIIIRDALFSPSDRVSYCEQNTDLVRMLKKHSSASKCEKVRILVYNSVIIL